MGHSSLLGGDDPLEIPDGRSTGALGPSDSTDSGSDLTGVLGPDELESDSDRWGTGERAAIEPLSGRSAGDILPDHLERRGGAADLDADDADQALRSVEELDSDADTDPGIDSEVALGEGDVAVAESASDQRR